MSADQSLAADSISDQPPRTWRGWWRARPKWLRIGMWAALGLALLHVVVAARIAIGLIESREISLITQRGGYVSYFWEIQPLYFVPVKYYESYTLLVAGLFGRSNRNVEAIVLDDATDDDLRLIGANFTQVKNLSLRHATVTPAGTRALRSCRRLERLDAYASTIDDAGIAPLAACPRISWLELGGTCITDAAFRDLKRMSSLEYLDLSYTRISKEAINAARLQSNPGVNSEKSDSDYQPTSAVVVWLDDVVSERLSGAELVEQPVAFPRGVNCYFDNLGRRNFGVHLPGLIDDYVRGMKVWSNGEYQIGLRYRGHLSKPIPVRVKNGQPSIRHFEFQMPVTRQQALEGKP